MKSLLIVTLWVTMAQPWANLANTSFSKEINTQQASTIQVSATWGDVMLRLTDDPVVKVTGNAMINGQPYDDRIQINEKKKGDKIVIEIELEFDDIEKVVYLRDKEGNYTYTKSKGFDHSQGWKGFDSMNYGHHIEANYVIEVPRDKILKAYTTYGDIESKELPAKSHVVATYGDVEMSIDDFSSQADYYIESTYGHVDIAVPEDLNASLGLSTSYGSIYTDLNMNYKNSAKQGENCGRGEDIKTVMGNGMAKLDIEATYDNIYLRAL